MSFNRKVAAVGAALMVPAVSFAQGADPFATALADLTTKVGTYGAGLAGLAAVGVVFMLAIKYIKKLPKAG